jgi:TRAP-type mannitol/chloroaromatic compound transport system permease small subunit
MPRAIRTYVRYVDGINRAVGRLVMYLIFVMIGVLLLSSIARSVFNVSFIWVVEMAQFLLSAYYILGGGYATQLDAHVRMDLFYGRFSARGKAILDSMTSILVIFYLSILFFGAISSTQYAFNYGQKNYSAWAPPLWPIKLIMTIGIALMLAQMLAVLFKDVARARGDNLDEL